MPAAFGARMDLFVKGFMERIAINRPALILDADKSTLSSWNGMASIAMISATCDSHEADKVINHLQYLIKADAIDAIMFLNNGLGEVIRNVTKSLGILNTKMNLLIPNEDSVGLKLRLNSRLYAYQPTDGTSILLYENYKIRYACPTSILI